MQNPCYDYSPIVRRPRLELPDGKRLAVVVALNIEHYRFGQPALSLAQFTAQLVPDPLNYGWRDYGPRIGVWRLADLLEQHGIPPTAVVNSAVCEHYPELVEEGVKRGWTWVAHGVDNSTWQVGMERDEERALIDGVAGTIERATGRRPRGWLGPALTATMNTYDLLAELGFNHTMDWTNDDQPYRLQCWIVAVPYSTEVNDIPAFVLHHWTGEEFAQAVIDQFDQLYEEGADSLRVMGIGL